MSINLRVGYKHYTSSMMYYITPLFPYNTINKDLQLPWCDNSALISMFTYKILRTCQAIVLRVIAWNLRSYGCVTTHTNETIIAIFAPKYSSWVCALYLKDNLPHSLTNIA